MNETETPGATNSSKTIDLIDRNLARLGSTLEGIADRVARAGTEGVVPANFTSSAVKQIESLNGRVQSLDGERLVARSKETIDRYPAALTMIGAIAGAVLAQIAVVAVRNERRRASQGQVG